MKQYMEQDLLLVNSMSTNMVPTLLFMSDQRCQAGVSMSPPVGWGSTYCFTDVCIGSSSPLVSHQLLRETLLKFFLGFMFFGP